MKILWIGRGVVTLPGVGNAAVPAFRLVAHHAPQARIEAELNGRTTIVPLGELDWGHESMCQLNVDRAQLAKLGASNHQ